jgi:hypothetical protein
LWRKFPPRHPFQTGSSRSLDAYGINDAGEDQRGVSVYQFQLGE